MEDKTSLERALDRVEGFIEESAPKINAMHSLWGSGDADRDRKRRNTAKSMISPPEGGKERDQTICTPQNFLNCVAEVWPEGIALDPCSNPESIVVAEESYSLENGKDGTVLPWRERTYANPPFKTLKEWLEKMAAELAGGVTEIMLLIPVRTHRVWFRRMLLMAGCHVVYLDPLKFHLWKQTFPAPLCAIYFGARSEAFYRAFRALSKE